MTEKRKELMRTLKFTLFSLSAGVIQIIADVICNEVIGLDSWWSYLIALILSVLWNFTLNRKYTFQAVVNVPIAMLKVAAFYLVFTPVSAWLGQIAETAGWNGNLVQILTMLANFILEFAYFKFVVFKGKDEQK